MQRNKRATRCEKYGWEYQRHCFSTPPRATLNKTSIHQKISAPLPAHLAAVSAPFALLAEQIVSTLPRNPERTVALRKLLEAKDAAVRAKLAVE